MSPRYREACRQEMRARLPEILAWWRALPESRKHLLIGIKGNAAALTAIGNVLRKSVPAAR